MELKPFLVVFIHLSFITVCNSIFLSFSLWRTNFLCHKRQWFSSVSEMSLSGDVDAKCRREEKHHQHQPAGQPELYGLCLQSFPIQHRDIDLLYLPVSWSSLTRFCFHSLHCLKEMAFSQLRRAHSQLQPCKSLPPASNLEVRGKGKLKSVLRTAFAQIIQHGATIKKRGL